MAEQDPFAGGKEVTTKMVGFNKPGDFVKGVYTGKKHIDSKDVNLYELKAIVGTFHQLDNSKKLIETPISISEGEFVSVWGGKTSIDDLFAKSKFGEIVAIKFEAKSQAKLKVTTRLNSLKLCSLV